MTQDSFHTGRITVSELKGLNERKQHANNDVGEFDFLRGCVPINQNTLTKANGCKLLAKFDSPILSICQTNDSRNNVIIQTKTRVYIMSEAELFGKQQSYANLTLIAGIEEETMSRAILVHSATPGTAGGAYTTANAWQSAPLTAIMSQLNPDGSAANFVTALSSNTFTLAAGIYRIKGYSVMSNDTADVRMAARLFSVTAGQPAWNGAPNEQSVAKLSTRANNNESLEFGGDLNLAAPTQFQIQGLMVANQANSGFGFAMNKTTSPQFTSQEELYRWLEILKTA